MKIFLLSFVLLATAPSALANHGTRQIGTPLTTAEAALSTLYANPPLPMTAFKAGNCLAILAKTVVMSCNFAMIFCFDRLYLY